MSRRSLGAERSMMLALLLAMLPIVGCSGDDGAAGASTGTLTGSITNSANSGATVANATITTDPVVSGTPFTSDAAGAYSVQLPVGTYKLTIKATNFTTLEQNVSILAGISQTVNFALAPVSNVVLSVSGAPSGHALPGDTISLTASATTFDGSTVTGYAWTQTNSAQATITDADQQTATITLGDAAEYKRALLEHLKHPAGEAVEGRFAPRFEIMAIDPLSFEHGSMVKFQCVVTTTSGSYPLEVPIEAAVEFAAVSTGLRNLPIGVPVLMNGKDQASYDWALSVPSGSASVLMDATTQHPWFVPDENGVYSVTVTDLSVTDAGNSVALQIFAGEWWGGIEGQDANGRPETLCATACHATIHNDKFVDWSKTGHAEIFTNNINTGGHYGPDCFACHTVGYKKGGFDSTENYEAFSNAMFPNGLSHPDPNNWSTVLTDWPKQAAMANVQCDNCHGPSNSPAHLDPDNARVNVSAGVCGSCHGEPPRHARFQQWQESGHGNFDTALAEGTNGSCAKCHSAQGFLDWFDAGLDASFPGTGIPASEVQPITCVVCHDPHNVGTRSGDDNDVPLRLEGDTPELLGGFAAIGVGKGAMCIVCHNTRRGEAGEVINATPDRAPHGGAQGDVMMGQNGFFVQNVRGPHSLITDTCASCHLERTPPPADLSYSLSGTNHTFKADTSICADCHGGFTADSLIRNTERALEDLASALSVAVDNEIAFHVANGRLVRITGRVAGVSTTVDIGPATVVGTITMTEGSGRSTMTIVIDSVTFESVQLHGNTKIVDGGNLNGSLLANNYTQAGTDKVIAQVLWNFHLISNDGSGGVHNPGWVTDLFGACRDQLAAIQYPAN